MINRNKELLKNTVVLSIGQIVPKLLAFIILPILTTYLSKRDYGLYELTLSVASFCIPLFSLQIQQGVYRFLIEDNSEKQQIISNSFFFLILIFSIGFLPIASGWFLYTDDFFVSILFYVAYYMEMLLTWSGQTVRGLGDNLAYSLAYVIYSISFLLALFFFCSIHSMLFINDVIIAMIIAYTISALFLFIKVKLKKYICISSYNKKGLAQLIGYSWPMVISSIALWVVNLSDRFFVTNILGLEANAIYSVANKIPNLFNSFYGIFNLAWTENASKLTRNEKNSEYYSFFFKSFYNVMVGLMLMLICSSPIFFKLLINAQYMQAYSLMPWLFIGAFFNSLVSFLGSIYVGEKRTKDVGVSSAVGAIINILINLFFMKKYGIIVAAFSTIISYAIIFVYRAIDIKKYVTIKYDVKSIIGGLFVIVFVAIINIEFSYVFWIVSLVVALIYNAVYNRVFVLSLLKKMKIIKEK